MHSALRLLHLLFGGRETRGAIHVWKGKRESEMKKWVNLNQRSIIALWVSDRGDGEG